MSEADLPAKHGGENVAAVQGVASDLYPDLAVRTTGYDQALLADAVFWLAHGAGGRPLMRRPVLEIALVGGLLAELALANKIDLHDGTGSGVADCVCLRWELREGVSEYVYEWEAPVDATSRSVYDMIGADQELPLTTWLPGLAKFSLTMVRDRLQLTTQQPRPGKFRRGRHPTALPRAPTGGAADRAWAALSGRIHRLHPLSPADAVLIGLAVATGTRKHLLEGASARAVRAAEAAVAGLPYVLAEIVAQTEAAAARTAIAPRH